MKRYIASAILATTLMFASANFDWYASGQEAIAATSQVHSDGTFLEGRTKMVFWSRVKLGTDLTILCLVSYTLFGLFSTKQKRTNK